MRLSNSFSFIEDFNPGLLDLVLTPASHILDNCICDVRRDGAVNDARFVRLGVCRVLSQAASGRDFLQVLREVFDETIARSSFFDRLHQGHRCQILEQLNRDQVRVPDIRGESGARTDRNALSAAVADREGLRHDEEQSGGDRGMASSLKCPGRTS